MDMANKKVGRPKGSVSRVNRDIRTTIRGLIEHNFTAKEVERLISLIERQEGPKKAFDCYIALLEYSLPKLSKIEHTGADGEKLTIEHVLSSLKQPENVKMLPLDQKNDIIETQYEKLMEEDI